jgi:hypothetical protein
MPPSVPAPENALPENANVPPVMPKMGSCEVSLREGRVEIPAAGGEFPVPAALNPANCPASVAIAVSWLTLSDASKLELAAEPNLTSSTREAMVLVGGRSLLIRQAAPPQPALAAAPSRLVFAVNTKGESSKKRLTAWGEESSLVARPQHPWLVVTPKSGKDGRQAFEVAIKSGAALPPGRHDSTIELFAAGSPGRSLVIPVVVEVEGRFY